MPTRSKASSAKRKPSPAPPAPVDDPVSAYARSVVAGVIVTGRLVRLACERHLRDLEHAHTRGLRFDAAAAMRAIGFFGFLHHSKGEWAGTPIILEPWQQFIVGAVFGWLRADGTRRFRTAYIQVARKQGKSTVTAGVGLFLLVADGEPGAEVYSAATSREQAKIVYLEAERMVKASPALKKRVTKVVNCLFIAGTASKFQPLSSDASTMDGLNTHGALIDELHEHPSAEVVQKLDTSVGSRRQPLVWEITTAGWNRHSVCYEHREYSTKVLEGVIEDDTWFSYIAELDKDDDWRDPAVWVKANPNLGVSFKRDALVAQLKKAEELPGQQNMIRRLHLNQWTEQSTRWLDIATWDRGAEPFDVEQLRGRRCFGGLDLARVNDLSAFALVFPPIAAGERWKVLLRFWVPEEDIAVRAKRDRVPYDVWVRQGLIEATPGNTTDFSFIETEILGARALYDLVEVAYDRAFADSLVQRLMGEGLVMVPFGQGFLSMAAPTAELARLLLAGELQHGGNQVLRWNASNVSVRQDPAGNLKPDKEASTERIDGIVALIMALGRAMVQPAVPGSVYEERGVRSV